MNKTYLIAGGSSVVTLAAGAVGGYLFAKKKYEALTEERVTREVEATKKYFSIILMQERQAKDILVENLRNHVDTVKEIPLTDDQADDALAMDEVQDLEEGMSEADLEVRRKGRLTLANASRAMTNYNGMSTETEKPPLEEVVSRKNVFADRPRDPETGKFLRMKTDGKPDTAGDEPSLIEPEEFLENETEYDQESLLYFARDETLIIVASKEEEPTEHVGEALLKQFPDGDPNVDGDYGVIYVRNHHRHVEYQITRTYESLTTYMGLGEDDEELHDADEIVNQL